MQNVTRCPYCRISNDDDDNNSNDDDDNSTTYAGYDIAEAERIAAILRSAVSVLVVRNQFQAEGGTVTNGNVVSCNFGGSSNHTIVLKTRMFFSYEYDNDNYIFVPINGFYLFACETSTDGGLRTLAVSVRKYDETQPDDCRFRVHALPAAY
jgi:hypothetical protein